PAVELGDQPLWAPEHVDLVAGDGGVDLGAWEVVVVEEREESVLEHRARRACGLALSEARREVVDVQDLAEPRIVYGAGEGVWGQHAREVGERAGGGGDRDVPVARDVGFGEAVAVDDHAGAA